MSKQLKGHGQSGRGQGKKFFLVLHTQSYGNPHLHFLATPLLRLHQVILVKYERASVAGLNSSYHNHGEQSLL